MANPSVKQGESHPNLLCIGLLVSFERASFSFSHTDSLDDSAEYSELHDITDLTKHCILFAATVLAPKGLKLPATGTHRIESFCDTVLQEVERLDTMHLNHTMRVLFQQQAFWLNRSK